MLASVAGLVACQGGGELSIKTKEPQVKYYVGYNVDMFDFFVQEGGVRYSFTIQKDGDAEATSTGRMFFVTKAGEYTITCTATKGDKTETKQCTFDVYDSVPYMLLAKNNIIVDWRSKDSLNNIFSYSQYRIISESAYETVIDYVLVYDQADGSARKVDLSLDNPSGDGLWDGRRAFAFNYEGDYEFHLCARSTGGVAEDFLKVTAVENYSKYEDVETNLVVDEVARTAKWTAVKGAASYRVKVNNKSVTITDTELNLNDYLDKDFSRFDFAIIALDETGEVIGKKALKDVVITPEGYEGIVLSAGAHVDLQKDEVNIIPATCSIHSVAGISKNDTHFLAYRGEYGIGYYVDFYFTGNNLPQVCLFSNDMDTNLTNSEGGKGILIMNGIYSGHSRQLLYDSLRAFGPNRLDDPYNHGNLFVLKGGYEQLSKEFLQKDENANKKYKYVVGSEATAGGNVSIVLQLWTVDDNGNEELLYLVNKETKVKVEEVSAGNIIAYGAMAGLDVDTTFKFCRKPYLYNAEGDESAGAVFATNGEVMLAGKGLGSFAQPFTIIPAATDKNGTLAMGMSNSYVGLVGEYGVGTYIDINFKGNNMPEVMFFADKINGNMSGYSSYVHQDPYIAEDSGEKGLLISNGMIGHEQNDINEYFTIWGPNRIHMGEGAKLHRAFSTYVNKALASIKDTDENFGILVQSNLAKDEYKDTEFKYTVGTFDLTGKIGVHVKLYKIVNGEEILLCEYIKDTIVDVEELPAGAIVMYGSVKGATELTTFRYSEPYESKPDLVYSDGSVSADGTITLAGRKLGSNSQPFTVIPEALDVRNAKLGFNNSYVALLGEHGVGTYLDFTFTGNNMPEVMFFADKVNGNMSGYSDYLHQDPYIGVDNGEKGVLISNGMLGGNLDNDINEVFTVWGPNKIHMGEGVALRGAFVTYTKYALASIKETDASYGALVQSNLAKEENANVKFKYTIGTYEVSGKLGIHAILYRLDGAEQVRLAEYVTGTTLSLDQVQAGNIIIYGTVKGNEDPTVFKMSEPYLSQPPYIASGAAVASDGTITTNGGATGNRMYDLANVNNNYYALKGEYGVGTYVDAYFTGNNMPEIMFFSDIISGNMTAYNDYTYVSGSGVWTNYTLSGAKGMLFSNGFAGGANNNGVPDKYAIWGMNRVYCSNDAHLANGLRDAMTGGTIKIYDKTTAEAGVLSQLSLEEKLSETPLKYTVGTYADGDKMAIEVILANAETGEELAHINFTTEILVADVKAGSIIFYDTLKGAGNNTVFKVSEPYTFGEEGHVHEYNTLKFNDYQHWYECSCGRYVEKIDHTGGTASCDTKARCEVCEAPYGDYAHDFKTVEFDSDYHWYKCDCGATSEKVAHFGGIATTTEKAKCEVCGQPHGELIPEGAITTENATENADGSYTLKGGVSESAGASAIFKAAGGYVAIQGSYAAGYFVDLEFTGNNLPQVIFFADKLNGRVSSYDPSLSASNGEKGLVITNGVFSTSINTGLKDLHYTVDGGYVVGGMYLSAFGPNKINNNMLTLLQTPASRLTRVLATDTLLTYKGMSGDQSGRTYIYKVGTILDSDKTVIACAELIDKATGNLVATSNVDTGIASTELPAGNIIVTAGIKGADAEGNLLPTTVKVGKPYVGEFRNFASDASFNDDGSITLKQKTMTASGQMFAFIEGYAAPVTVSYFGIKGEYGVGTYVDFTFTGNNMPEVMLFASHINGWITGYKGYSGGKAATSGEKGVLISNGIGCTAIPARGTDKYFTVWGPNKLFLGEGATVSGVFSDHRTKANVLVPHTDTNYALLTQEVLADAKYANTNFKCSIGTYEAGEEVGLHITMYDVTSGEAVKLLEYKESTGIKLTDVSAGSIIFYDSMKGSDTVFKLGEITQPNEA